MIFKCITVIVLCSINSLLGAKYHLPDEFQKCNLTDPKLDDCLNNAIYNAIQLIGSKGIPSLGLQPIDPLEIKEFSFVGDTYSHHYYDAKMYGILKAKITNAHLDINQKILKFTTICDSINEARYNLSGKFLGIDTIGEGNVIVKTWKIKGDHEFKFQEKIKKNQKYWLVEDYRVDININQVSLNFESTVEGNKLITENVNRIFNENWEVGRDLIMPQVKQIGGIVMKKVANSLFEKVPIDEILLK